MIFDPERQIRVAGRTMTASEHFFDAMIRHQIGILRVSGSISNEVQALLDATEDDVRRQIEDKTRLGIGITRPAQVARLERLLDSLASIRSDAFKQVSETWFSSLTDLSLAEPGFVDGILRTTMPVDLDTKLPSARLLRDIVKSRPFEGLTLKEWSIDLERADISRIEKQIKIGLTQGETGQQIARRVVGSKITRGADGVLEITRRQAEMLTRTAVNAIANESRREYHLENVDIIQAELYVATLDSRTTHVCASLDGQQFAVGVGPIPPVHFGCRSLRVALVDDEAIGNRPARSFTQKQLLREFSAQEGIDPVSRRADLPHGTKGAFDEFARRRKRELTGIGPAKVPYQEFLERQSTEFQDDYLGLTKGRLFRAGLPLTRVVDPAGRPITLATLARTDADAFRAAGLDPEDFL